MATTSADNYHHYEQHEHIYNIPDTYIGSLARNKHIVYGFDWTTGEIVEIETDISQGAERCFIEISSNAGDNSYITRDKGFDPLKVEYTFTEKTIKIKNYGVVPEIKIHEELGIYVQQMIFGTLRTSANYDPTKTRYTCGRNGYGAKLPNIFSTRFKATVKDGKVDHRSISITWTNNMYDIEEPVIKENYNGPSYVEIEYDLEFARFDMTEYTDDMMKVFARHAIDLSLCWKIPVVINGETFDYSNIVDYAKLLFGKCSNAIIHRQYSKDRKHLPEVEVCIVETINEGYACSFINGMQTTEHGVHFEACIDALGSIVSSINTEMKDQKVKMSSKDLVKHISFIVTAQLPDPVFSNQSKTKLGSPRPAVKYEKATIDKVFSWKHIIDLFIHELALRAKAKGDKSARKVNGRILLDKGYDANLAGSDQGQECTLIICEGKSAEAWVRMFIGCMEDGYSYFGSYPVRGKFINSRVCSVKKLLANKEYNDIVTLMGFEPDTDYSEEANRKSLRYGRILLATDADDDGAHIKGLIMGMIEHLYPSILSTDVLQTIRTPMVVATVGGRRVKFYTNSDYDQWCEETPDHDNQKKYKQMFYKGLGTNTKKDVLEVIADPRIVVNVSDEKTKESMDMCFGRGQAGKRKEWANRIDEARGLSVPNEVQEQTVTEFVDNELIFYTVSNILRSIPSFQDGLKQGQRKVVYSVFRNWSKENKPKNGLRTDLPLFKVAQFAGYVAQHENYHHGEKCLEDTIVHLAQDYIGSGNNILHLDPEGQFGSRAAAGKDRAQSRYLFTKPNELMRFLYVPADFNLVPQMVEEGQKIEPEFLLPILPMALINQCIGVGTGWSTFIPPHDPLRIIDWLENKISGSEKQVFVKVWYRGFTGDVEMKTVNGENANLVAGIMNINDPDEEESQALEDMDEAEKMERYRANDEDIVFVDKFTTKTVELSGCYEVNGPEIVITELPPGRCDNYYLEHLEKLRRDKKISNYEMRSTDTKPRFHMTPVRGNIDEEDLKLSKTLGLSNMVLLVNGKPRRFETVYDILETFYDHRLPYYEKRRLFLMNMYQEEVGYLKNKARFIKLVVEDKIIVSKRKREDIKKDMVKHKIPVEILTNIRLTNLTEEDIKELEEEVKVADKKYQKYKNTTDKLLWLEDLDAFKTAYIKWLGEKEKEEEKANKSRKKRIGAKGGKSQGDEKRAMKTRKNTPPKKTKSPPKKSKGPAAIRRKPAAAK